MRRFFYFYRNTFARTFDYKGRTDREAYWSYVLFQGFIVSGFTMLASCLSFMEFMSAVQNDFENLDGSLFVTLALSALTLIGALYGLVSFFPSLAASVRRYRDAGHSPWEFVILLVLQLACVVYVLYAVFGSMTFILMDNTLVEVYLAGLACQWLTLIQLYNLSLPSAV